MRINFLIYIILLTNYINRKCPKVSLTIIWYNKELSVRKLSSERPWFFIPYSLNEIVHVSQMKMEYFICNSM